MHSALGMEPKPHTPPLWKSVWQLCEKLDLPSDPAILLWAYAQKAISCYVNTCSSMFIAALFTIDDRTWKQTA